VRHVVELLLGVVYGGDDVGCDVLQALGQAVLLGSSLTSALTALGLCGDLAVGIEAAKGAVALLQNATGLLDERLDVVDQLVLVELVLGCAVGLVHVLLDLLAHRLHTLESLLADAAHLLGDLALLLTLGGLLELLLGGALVGLLVDVLEQSALADLVAVDVDNVSVVVDLLTNTVTEVSIGELTDKVTVLIADLTLLVNTHARHGVDTALLLLRLPALGHTDLVAVLVNDGAVLLDTVTEKLLDVTLSDATNDVAAGGGDSLILVDLEALEAGKGTFGAGVLSEDKLAASNDVTGVVPDLALTVDLLANKSLSVTLGDATNDGAVAVNSVAGLVDGGAGKSRHVDLLLLDLLLLPRISMALDVAVLVDDVAILVNSKANKTLGVALDDLADDIAILILNLAILDNAQTLKTGEGTLRASDTLVLRDDLALADDLAGVAVDETVLITAAASKLLDVALDKTAEGNALLVDDVALLVEHLVLKDAVVHFFFLLFLFLPGVGVTLDVAVLVDNVAVLIDSETNQALGVALDDLTNDVLVLVGDLATLDDTKAFEAGEGTLRFGLALLLGNELDAANDLTLVVPELALVVELPAGNLLGLALDQAGDGSSLLADDDTSLVDLLALQEGQVDRLLLLLGLLFLLVAVGVTDDRALLVDDVSVFVNRATEKLLGVTLSDNTNNVAVLVSDVAVLDDLEALEASEGSFLLVLFLGNSLGAADDLALVVPELSLGVGGDAGLGELLGVALNKLTNNVAIAVEKLASLVARKAVKDGERGKGIALLFFFLVLALTFLLLFAFLGLLALNLAFTFLAFRGLFLLFLGLLRKSADRTKDGLAILVEDLALVVDLLAGALGKLAVSKLTNLLAIFVQDLALLVELVALKGLNARSVVLLGQLTELLKKLLGGGLSSLTLSDANLADNIALLVDDLALLVDLLAGALGRVALGELTNLLTIVIKDLALLVDLRSSRMRMS